MDEVVVELGRIAAEERAAARQRAHLAAVPSAQLARADEGAGPPQAAASASESGGKKKSELHPPLLKSAELLPSQTSSRTRQGLMLIVGVIALFVYAMIGGFFIYRIMTQP